MWCGAAIRGDSTFISREWLCRHLVFPDSLASPFAQVHPWPLHTEDPILESFRLALPLPGPLSALWKHTGLQHPLAAGKTPLQVQPLLSLHLAKDLLCQTKSWSCVRSVSTPLPPGEVIATHYCSVMIEMSEIPGPPHPPGSRELATGSPGALIPNVSPFFNSHNWLVSHSPLEYLRYWFLILVIMKSYVTSVNQRFSISRARQPYPQLVQCSF